MSTSQGTFFVRSRILLAVLALVLSLGTAGESRSAESDEAMRRRGLERLRYGAAEEASAIFDSLLTRDLSDLMAGYLAAKAEAQRGNTAEARCRWLEIETAGGTTKVAALAAARRRLHEQEAADALSSAAPSDASVAAGGAGLALLPLEEFGGASTLPYFGLAWSYLLVDALGGSGLCPVSIPTMLFAQDLVSTGRGVRVPAELLRSPINTTHGVLLRLSLLPRRDGGSYIFSRATETELREGLLAFQRDEGLLETGEADLPTQERLSSRMDQWIEQPPQALLPSRLGEFLGRVGANLALRGTYRWEGESILVEMSLISSSGQAIHAEPIRRRFRPSETTATAFAVAEEIARIAGGRFASWRKPAPTLRPDQLGPLAAVLMRMDRGALFVEEVRWSRLDSKVFDWPFAAGARDLSGIGMAGLDQMEQKAVSDWVGRIRLDANEAMSGWMTQLGDPTGGGFRGAGGVQVLGRDGVIRVREGGVQ